jgi:hypothetical protein
MYSRRCGRRRGVGRFHRRPCARPPRGIACAGRVIPAGRANTCGGRSRQSASRAHGRWAKVWRPDGPAGQKMNFHSSHRHHPGPAAPEQRQRQLKPSRRPPMGGLRVPTRMPTDKPGLDPGWLSQAPAACSGELLHRGMDTLAMDLDPWRGSCWWHVRRSTEMSSGAALWLWPACRSRSKACRAGRISAAPGHSPT